MKSKKNHKNTQTQRQKKKETHFLGLLVKNMNLISIGKSATKQKTIYIVDTLSLFPSHHLSPKHLASM